MHGTMNIKIMACILKQCLINWRSCI